MCPDKKTDVVGIYPLERIAASNVRLQRKVAQLEHEVAEARHLAYHDSLTGLPNRALLLDRMKQALIQARRQRKALAVMLLDLDRFKHVNDQFGHAAGDVILQAVAERLTGCIRGCDTACRYGGDEFAILLPQIRGTGDVEAVEQKVRAHLSMPHRIGERVVVIGASIGAAVFDKGDVSCAQLIDAADAAMYRDKTQHVAGR